MRRNSLKRSDDQQQVKAKWLDEMRTGKVKLGKAGVKDRRLEVM